MKPLHVNLAVLALLVGIALAVLLLVGQGPVLQGLLVAFSLGWAAQLVGLWWSTRRLQTPPTFASKETFAAWAAAAYPFLLVDRPEFAFPTWFVLASIPIGFAMAYTLISALLWMTRLQASWRMQLKREE